VLGCGFGSAWWRVGYAALAQSARYSPQSKVAKTKRSRGGGCAGVWFGWFRLMAV